MAGAWQYSVEPTSANINSQSDPGDPLRRAGRITEYISLHLCRLHAMLYQGIQRAIDHGGRPTGDHPAISQIWHVLDYRLIQQAATPFPAVIMADYLVQIDMFHFFPLVPGGQPVKTLYFARTPVQMNRRHATLQPGLFKNTVHLRHAGTSSNQQQRPLISQVDTYIAKWQLHPGNLVFLQFGQQLHGRCIRGQDLQTQHATFSRSRSNRIGIKFTRTRSQHQILARLIYNSCVRWQLQANLIDFSTQAVNANYGALMRFYCVLFHIQYLADSMRPVMPTGSDKHPAKPASLPTTREIALPNR